MSASIKLLKGLLTKRAIRIGAACQGAIAIGMVSMLASPASAGNLGFYSCSFGTNPDHPLCFGNSDQAEDPINWVDNYMQLGDKRLTLIEADTDFGGTSGTINFDQVGAAWVVNTDFDIATTPGKSGQVAYTLTIDPLLGAGNSFATVQLDVTSTTNPTTVNKIINGSTILTSENGVPFGVTPISGTAISVVDTFDITNTGSIDSIANTYTQTTQTPGPLPLLGAGAAFGFSRRLRSRIRNPRLRISGLAKS